jgi:hypothetical protein
MNTQTPAKQEMHYTPKQDQKHTEIYIHVLQNILFHENMKETMEILNQLLAKEVTNTIVHLISL